MTYIVITAKFWYQNFARKLWTVLGCSSISQQFTPNDYNYEEKVLWNTVMLPLTKQFNVLLFNGPLPASFFFIFVFSIQLTVKFQYNFLPMSGFEPRTSGIGIGSDRSTNWAATTVTTTAPVIWCFYKPCRFQPCIGRGKGRVVENKPNEPA